MTPRTREISATLGLAVCIAAGHAAARSADPGDVIASEDPRFAVFERANSAGGGTYASPVGTVLMSFVSKDRRYCRTARFSADRNVLLACREDRGWKIEATSELSQTDATTPTSVGGSPLQEVGEAIEALMASIEPMSSREVIAAASSGWRDPAPVDEQTFDARDVLRKSAIVYRTSKSYSDTGTVQTEYTNISRTWIGETRFKTAYVAPDRFRFEATMQEMPRVEYTFVAWRDGHDVQATFSIDPDFNQKITSLADALDAAAGISRDTSGMIPGLLVDGMKLGGDIVRLADPVRLDDTLIDGIDCFQVQGKRWPHDGPTTVWIDKESFLILKIYEEDLIRNGTTKTTWRYQPARNAAVDEADLQFNGPAQAAP